MHYLTYRSDHCGEGNYDCPRLVVDSPITELGPEYIAPAPAMGEEDVLIDGATNWNPSGYGSRNETWEVYSASGMNHYLCTMPTPEVGGNPSDYVSAPPTLTVFGDGDFPSDAAMLDATKGCFQIASDDVYDGWRFSLEYYENDYTGSVLGWFQGRTVLQQFDNRDAVCAESLLFFKSFLSPGSTIPDMYVNEDIIEQAYLFINGIDYYADVIAGMRILFEDEIAVYEDVGQAVYDNYLLAHLFMV